MSVRTAPRPAGEGWRKVPSVYTGGASHFWHRRTADALEWLAYDRVMRSWCHTREPFAGEVTREYVPMP